MKEIIKSIWQDGLRAFDDTMYTQEEIDERFEEYWKENEIKIRYQIDEVIN